MIDPGFASVQLKSRGRLRAEGKQGIIPETPGCSTTGHRTRRFAHAQKHGFNICSAWYVAPLPSVYSFALCISNALVASVRDSAYFQE